MKIAKTFEFDAGHRLSRGYVGKCANLHGHRYKVEVELEAVNLTQYDMVHDFNDLKWFKQWLDETFDHKMLLWENDPILRILIPEFVNSSCNKDELDVVKELHRLMLANTTLMVRNPTAEHIAEVCLQKAAEWAKQFEHVIVKRVRVQETPNCWAEAS